MKISIVSLKLIPMSVQLYSLHTIITIIFCIRKINLYKFFINNHLNYIHVSDMKLVLIDLYSKYP
jgi:hypothetical protein